MKLATMPRRHYTNGATPLEHLARLSEQVGGPQLWIKRDDELGLTAGGNKTRKLEFLVADALAKGADTLLTAGGVQSNHCRLTLSAAVKEGLDCHLLVMEDLGADGNPVTADDGGNPPTFNGNFLLFNLLGAKSVEVHPHGFDILERMEALADELRAQGRNPYVIAPGGSTVIGALGYVDCARELLEQSDAADFVPSAIVAAAGSGGMLSGLISGVHALERDVPVVGITVGSTSEAVDPWLVTLANGVASHLELPEVSSDKIVTLDEFYQPGYGLPNDGMIEAVRLFASLEGILLDPVYTGKAAAGFLALARSGKFGPDDALVFVHSGGVPSLYAHAGDFN